VLLSLKKKKIQHDLLHNRFACSKKTRDFNHYERSNKNRMITMTVILTCKKKTMQHKKVTKPKESNGK
jgi:hypothetical protein